MANAWTSVIATAIRGGDAPLAPTLPAAVRDLVGSTPHADGAAATLRSAAALVPYRLAGRRPDDAVDAPEPASDDDLPPCGRGAARLLRTLLEENAHVDLLPEWCSHAAGACVRAPDHLLPGFLRRLARAARPTRPRLVTALGARGRWLAKAHPDWRALAAEVGVEAPDWDTGTLPERVRALELQRADDPDAARERLAGEWGTLSTDEQAQLLEPLRIELSERDEPFLEDALATRAIAVRRAAADLLVRLESRHAERMRTLVGRHVQWAGKGLLGKRKALLVELPEGINTAMRRDGLSARQRPGLGRKASLVAEFVARAPLSTWSAHPPEAWIEAGLKSDWADALLTGWAEATESQASRAWAEVVVEQLLSARPARKKKGTLASVQVVDLMPLLAPDVGERIATKHVLTRDRWTEAARVLLAMEHEWSTEFSAALVRLLQRLKPLQYSNSWEATHALAACAPLRLHPDSADAVARPWPGEGDDATPAFQELLDTLRRTLDLRAAIRRELTP